MDAMHDYYTNKEIKFTYMPTDALPADALTKSLSGPTLLKHKRFMNLIPIGHGLKGRVDVNCSHSKSNISYPETENETDAEQV